MRNPNYKPPSLVVEEILHEGGNETLKSLKILFKEGTLRSLFFFSLFALVIVLVGAMRLFKHFTPFDNIPGQYEVLGYLALSFSLCFLAALLCVLLFMNAAPHEYKQLFGEWALSRKKRQAIVDRGMPAIAWDFLEYAAKHPNVRKENNPELNRLSEVFKFAVHIAKLTGCAVKSSAAEYASLSR